MSVIFFLKGEGITMNIIRVEAVADYILSSSEEKTNQLSRPTNLCRSS
jgi:hypothetical protein